MRRHGNGYNLTDQPRFAQFVNYSNPAERIPADPQKLASKQEAWESAGRPELTPAGARLFGLVEWTDQET